MRTNVKDRYKAWRADPATPPEPTLASAFAEGFTQAFEVASGQLREPGSVSSSELTQGWDE